MHAFQGLGRMQFFYSSYVRSAQH